MIVKILKKSATFKAVRYNTGKVEKDRGELLLVKNFGVLQGLEDLRPQDYINYLEAVSARSTRTKYPQFHVAISTKGRAHSKEELSDIAQQWMDGMGYGDQPYLLIYHKDTANNHLHVVSTRVGRDGKKISDRYEKLRAYRVLNQVMGEGEKQAVTGHLQKALAYSFSTRAQFMMILEAKGYVLTLKDGAYAISKDGRELASLEASKVDERIKTREKDKGRVGQIRTIIERYRTVHDPSPNASEAGYTSVLAKFLHEKLGLQVLFHVRDDKPPYGYTLIDHSGKAVYKGGEIMPLAEFIAPMQTREGQQPGFTATENVNTKQMDAPENAETTSGRFWENDTIPDDKPSGDTAISDDGQRQEPQPQIHPDTDPGFVLPTIDINISDDIDDEAILGRNRRRKQKARTNTR
ncbi:relaxase/mobilization nuclease domain-containing protein [Sphingobacterium sp. JB170]|uniref:relaxase/mobilization nuclease domain-containing protein n=1 Tax=Sphingobacterium sp. JB170 TaxID=1434842 RepID=UPI00097E7C7B|nr:relaxase/mobilization nuclease domain-containing protein [Sphingobacterium sp. JB170]SJN22503.1 Putative conjugative transposon mobilization protein BF0132 [Sphingobacterium sp. JB170]